MIFITSHLGWERIGVGCPYHAWPRYEMLHELKWGHCWLWNSMIYIFSNTLFWLLQIIFKPSVLKDLRIVPVPKKFCFSRIVDVNGVVK